MTSGSTYVVGFAFGDQSRGGVVIVLAGSAGLPAGGACALATIGASAVVPAITPTAPMNFRREITLPLFMAVLLDRRDVPAARSAAFDGQPYQRGQVTASEDGASSKELRIIFNRLQCTDRAGSWAALGGATHFKLLAVSRRTGSTPAPAVIRSSRLPPGLRQTRLAPDPLAFGF